MRALNPLIDFYINSSVHVALAVVCLALVTQLNNGFPISSILLLYIFFGTVTGYNFVKYADVAGLHHRSLTRKLKTIQIFSFLCFVALLATAVLIELKVLLWSAFFGIFTLLYALPILTDRRNLRSIPGIKVFIIAFVWAGVTVVLPAIVAANSFSATLAIEFLQRFLLVLVWILPFEIRDLKYDRQQLGTIPQKIGVTKTKLLGTFLLVVISVLESIKPATTIASSFALFGSCLITLILLWKTKVEQYRYFTAFWVEGIPVFWLLLLLLLRGA